MSIRGAHLPALAGWRRAGEQRFGAVTVTTWENPAPAQVLDDLVSLRRPAAACASRAGTRSAPSCTARPQSGGPGLRPGHPGRPLRVPRRRLRRRERRDRPRLRAPPLRLRAAAGRTRRCASTSSTCASAARSTATTRSTSRPSATSGARPSPSRSAPATPSLGSMVHRDGDGWKPFELDTSALAGQTGELVAGRSPRPAATAACTASRRTPGEAALASACPTASAGAITSSAPPSALAYVAWLLATARARSASRATRASTSTPASDYVALVAHALRARARRAPAGAPSTSAFEHNHEHPALMKTLFGCSWSLLPREVARLRRREHRLPPAGDGAWRGSRSGSRTSSARARGAGARAPSPPRCSRSCPHVFFHAHLACFDVPIMAMWILCVYVHWRAQETPSAGLGARRRASSTASRSRPSTTRGSCRSRSCRTRSSCTATRSWSGPARRARVASRRAWWRWRSSGRSCSSLLWPYLWNDTLARIQWYVEFHLQPRVLQHRVPRQELLRPAVAEELPARDDRSPRCPR